jgi:hypothetical protein
MHSDPYADTSIPERLHSAQQLKRGEASHNSVQVVCHRRTENSEKSIAQLTMNDATVLMHGYSHLL